MTISVLLPTRNRLEYLELAIQTVLRQESADWELVVSDNDSQENIEGHVASIGDSRIRYHRTDHFVSVTENWNAALSHSSGDYIVMLGDDDGLLPGYLTRMQDLVERFAQPDLIFSTALLFTYPGVDPGYPDGYLEPNGFADFLNGARAPFVLEPSRARAAVRKTMDFKLAFAFNMQFSLISRRLVEQLRPQGHFFQSAFPDYYATTASFLNARRVVVEPEPQVVIGVTPKSYGFFHVNKREAEGRSFLSADNQSSGPLPGTNINDGWLSAVEALEANYGNEFGLRVNRRRYRLLQAANVYQRRREGTASPEEVARLGAGLSRAERVAFRGGDALIRLLGKSLPAALVSRLYNRTVAQFPPWSPPRQAGGYANLLEVFESRLNRLPEAP